MAYKRRLTVGGLEKMREIPLLETVDPYNGDSGFLLSPKCSDNDLKTCEVY